MLVDHSADGPCRDAEFTSSSFLAPIVGAQSAVQLGLVDAVDIQAAIIQVGRNDACDRHIPVLFAGLFELIWVALVVDLPDLGDDVVPLIPGERCRLIEAQLL